MFITYSDTKRTIEIDGDIFFHYEDGGLMGISFKTKGAEEPEMHFPNGIERVSDNPPDPPAQFNEPSIFPNDPHDEDWMEQQEREHFAEQAAGVGQTVDLIEKESTPDLVGRENMDYTQ